ncbi:glycerol channel [Dimargaris xerosporica]|nr:glycerol channel [Dimargaris xerosporica]
MADSPSSSEYQAVTMKEAIPSTGGANSSRWHTHDSKYKSLRTQWHQLRVEYRDYLAEFIGTLVLIFFGDSVCATTKMFSAAQSASWVLISFGWGFGLTMALFVSGGISGGHLNPAVTVTAAVFRGFPWRKVPGYIASQLLGGFVGAALVFGLFKAAIDEFDGGERQVTGDKATAGIFATYPQPYLTIGWALMSEIYCTAALILCIYGIGDMKNMPGMHYAPLAIGFVVTTIGICCGYQTGYAMNAARDFAPRVFTLAAGYGSETFTAGNNYAWVPVVGPLIGALLGAGLYDTFIVHPIEEEEKAVV